MNEKNSPLEAKSLVPRRDTHFLHRIFQADQASHPMPPAWAKAILQKLLTCFSNDRKRSH